MIEDLDVIVESRPTLRERWLLPAAGIVVVAAVLASSFAQLRPARSTGAVAPADRVSVLRDARPATGFRSLIVPPGVGATQLRTQFSGVTGLTTTRDSDGFRDLYRLSDGRLLVLIEYPDPGAGGAAAPVDALELWHRVAVRGVTGIGYRTASQSLPLAIAWSADGMQYVLGGAAFSEEELVSLAARLR